MREGRAARTATLCCGIWRVIKEGNEQRALSLVVQFRVWRNIHARNSRCCPKLQSYGYRYGHHTLATVHVLDQVALRARLRPAELLSIACSPCRSVTALTRFRL